MPDTSRNRTRFAAPAAVRSRAVAVSELSAAFIGLPLTVGWLLPPTLWLPSLWLVALASAWRSSHDVGARPALLCAPINWKDAPAKLRPLVVRFLVSAVLLGCLMAIVAPSRLLESPRPRLAHWIVFLLLYPLLSVLAQEQLYRRYLFHRLRDLNLSAVQVVWASAIAFAAMHAIYRNGTAVALTLIGGWFFADTYRRTGSLRLVCLEHVLYGSLLFATGLWPFFSHEAVIL